MLDQIRRNTRRNPIQSVFVFGIFFAAAVFAVMLAPTPADAEDDITIVSVDMQKVYQSHPAFMNAREKLQEELDAKKQELNAMEESDRQMAQQQMQQDLQQKNQELQEAALAKVREDIQKIADEKGYDYVVNSSILLAGGKDVTQEFMDALDLEPNSASE